MKTIFDLPAHPLFVHVPIVLLPLLAIVTIVAAVRPKVARVLGVWLPVASLLVFVSVLLAVNTGEALDHALRQNPNYAINITKHASLARTTRLLSFLLLLATAALWWVNRTVTAATSSSRKPLRLGTTVVVVVLAALSTAWMIRTGHEGARSHWNGILPK